MIQVIAFIARLRTASFSWNMLIVAANMPEVMKTRLQLQGELQKLDANAPRVYKNVLDVFAKTWRHEGVKGLQRGLMPAVCPLLPLRFWTHSLAQ